MRTISWYLFRLAAILIFAFPFSAAHSNDNEAADPIACVKAIELLSKDYRIRLKTQCFVVAGDMCLAQAEKRECLKRLNDRLISFFDELYPLLPPEIPGVGIVGSSYKRNIEKWQTEFIDEEECKGKVGVDFLVCKYVTLGVATSALLFRARQAKVKIP